MLRPADGRRAEAVGGAAQRRVGAAAMNRPSRGESAGSVLHNGIGISSSYFRRRSRCLAGREFHGPGGPWLTNARQRASMPSPSRFRPAGWLPRAHRPCWQPAGYSRCVRLTRPRNACPLFAYGPSGEVPPGEGADSPTIVLVLTSAVHPGQPPVDWLALDAGLRSSSQPGAQGPC
jgi:hypothetical protein